MQSVVPSAGRPPRCVGSYRAVTASAHSRPGAQASFLCRPHQRRVRHGAVSLTARLAHRRYTLHSTSERRAMASRRLCPCRLTHTCGPALTDLTAAVVSVPPRVRACVASCCVVLRRQVRSHSGRHSAVGQVVRVQVSPRATVARMSPQTRCTRAVRRIVLAVPALHTASIKTPAARVAALLSLVQSEGAGLHGSV